jgi:hypothetical protein
MATAWSAKRATPVPFELILAHSFPNSKTVLPRRLSRSLGPAIYCSEVSPSFSWGLQSPQWLTARLGSSAEGLLGLGRRPGSLVARWCSGLARVDHDPANDGLWTSKEPRKRPIDGSSNLPRATITSVLESYCLNYFIHVWGVISLSGRV